jgi:hypothetical protein
MAAGSGESRIGLLQKQANLEQRRLGELEQPFVVVRVPVERAHSRYAIIDLIVQVQHDEKGKKTVFALTSAIMKSQASIDNSSDERKPDNHDVKTVEYKTYTVVSSVPTPAQHCGLLRVSVISMALCKRASVERRLSANHAQEQDGNTPTASSCMIQAILKSGVNCTLEPAFEQSGGK